MIILAHVVIALLGVVVASWAYLSPARSKLYIAGSLVVLTIASGTYLVISKPAHLVSSCMMGLAYLAAVGAMMALAYRKLARQTSTSL